MDGKFLLEILNTLVQTPLAAAFVFILTDEWRCSRKKASWIFFSVLAVLTAADLYVFQNFEIIRQAKDIITVVNIVVCLGMVLALSKYRQGRMVFIFLTASSFAMMGAMVGEIVGSSHSPVRIMLKLCISGIIFLLVLRYLRKPCLEMMEQIKNGWHKLALIPFFLSALCLSMLSTGRLYYDRQMKLIGMMACVIVAAFYVVLYHNFVQLREQFRINAAYNMMEAQLASLQERAESMQEANDQMAIFRHDMRHFIQIQKTCLESGDIPRAEKILATMDENIRDIGGLVKQYTGNFIIDSVLSDYEKRTANSGILYDVKMELPEDLKPEHLELAVVLANGLENAFHACLDIPEEKPRIIRLKGVKEKKQYFLEIANLTDGKVAFDPKTKLPVAMRPEHGYGTQSIQAFASKYDAFVDYKFEDGWFKLRIIFN